MSLNISYGIMEDIAQRNAVITYLIQQAKHVPASWHQHLAESSLTLTSADRGRIIKIDSYKNYTLDVRQPDGTYKSHRFPCKSAAEAWSMAYQIVKTYRPKHALH